MSESAQSQPLLSICVPTYNRADCLEVLLSTLVKECESHAEDVEIVVSDNASTDTTPQIADRYSGHDFLHWHRQTRNIGAPANVASCAMELANGRFCWIIGDDDLVLPGGVEKVLKSLQCNPAHEILFVNFAAIEYETIRILASKWDPDFRPEPEKLESREHVSKAYPSAIDFLQTGKGRIDYFSAILGLVISVDLWKKFSLTPAELTIHDPFSSFEISFPHMASVFGSPSKTQIFYLAEPICLLGMGMREWSDQWSKIICYQFPRIIELYSDSGARTEYTNLMRAKHLDLLLRELPMQIRGGLSWAQIARPIFHWCHLRSVFTKPVRDIFRQKTCSVFAASCVAIFIRSYGRLPENIKKAWRRIKRLTHSKENRTN